MKNYLDLCGLILGSGVKKDDRTGTGTLSIFAPAPLVFDLAYGFPLLTTKFTSFRLIKTELLWFLSGSTNTGWLEEQSNHIWREWQNDSGELGPLYGHQYRQWGRRPDAIKQPKPKLKIIGFESYAGVADGTGKGGHPLAVTWQGMITRCYDPKNIGYPLYGGRGVFVCDDWLEFRAFARDAEKLPGWDQKKRSPREYCLDKDGIGNGFTYGPKHCQWISQRENAYLKSKWEYTLEKDGEFFSFTNETEFREEHGLSAGNLTDLWTGRKSAEVRHGFRFVSKRRLDGGIDQIANVINTIKTDPNSRRMIVSAWNVADLSLMALEPCHLLFQFSVTDGRLSCQMYQRSGDMFLGVPFNIASYALLTSMIAQCCDLKPGILTVVLGDAHIYSNHVTQTEQMLKLPSHPLPELYLNPTVKDIDMFRPDLIDVIGYVHGPIIPAKVAV